MRCGAMANEMLVGCVGRVGSSRRNVNGNTTDLESEWSRSYMSTYIFLEERTREESHTTFKSVDGQHHRSRLKGRGEECVVQDL